MKLKQTIPSVLFIFLFFPYVSFSQEEENFTLIYIYGKIYLQPSNLLLERGMMIKSDDQIKFENTRSKAVVISNKRGRFILSPVRYDQPGRFREGIEFVKNIVFPLKTNAILSTRSDSEVTDFGLYFGKNADSAFHILGDELRVLLKKGMFQDNSKEFFVLLKYSSEGQIRGRKKLKRVGDTLILKKEEALSLKEESDSTFKLTLCRHRLDQNMKSIYDQPIEFQPAFLPEDEIRKSYEVLYRSIKNINLEKKDKEEHLIGYFRDTYGRTDWNYLRYWLQKNFEK